MMPLSSSLFTNSSNFSCSKFYFEPFSRFVSLMKLCIIVALLAAGLGSLQRIRVQAHCFCFASTTEGLNGALYRRMHS